MLGRGYKGRREGRRRDAFTLPVFTLIGESHNSRRVLDGLKTGPDPAASSKGRREARIVVCLSLDARWMIDLNEGREARAATEEESTLLL